MRKIKIGTIEHLTIVKGDANLLGKNEVLVSKEERYTILRKRLDTGILETYVIVPLKDFRKDETTIE